MLSSRRITRSHVRVTSPMETRAACVGQKDTAAGDLGASASVEDRRARLCNASTAASTASTVDAARIAMWSASFRPAATASPQVSTAGLTSRDNSRASDMLRDRSAMAVAVARTDVVASGALSVNAWSSPASVSSRCALWSEFARHSWILFITARYCLS